MKNILIIAISKGSGTIDNITNFLVSEKSSWTTGQVLNVDGRISI